MRFIYGSVVLLSLYSLAANADQLILDDLDVNGSLCVGTGCVDGEVFDFDTIRLKTDNPQILFQDTSVSASFPTNDWLMGATDNGVSAPAYFFIRDVDGGSDVMVLESGATGGVAIGSGSAVEANNVSVGSLGHERRITNVSDGVDATDAVTMGQFNQFKIDQESAVASRIDEINNRLDALIVKVNNL